MLPVSPPPPDGPYSALAKAPGTTNRRYSRWAIVSVCALAVGFVGTASAFAFEDALAVFFVTVPSGFFAIVFGIAAWFETTYSDAGPRGRRLAILCTLLGSISFLWGVSFLGQVRGPAARMQSQNNMKQLALGFHNYESAYNKMPPAVIRDNNGRPLLSWRVAIIEYLESGPKVFDFHLDEPWDSPHNLQYLDKMPRIYRSTGKQPPESHMTYYRVFVGPGTPFERDGLSLARDFPDGTSNTILIVEADEAVPWTKPDELEYHPEKPLPALGGMFKKYNKYHRMVGYKDGFNAVTADGSAHWFDRNTDEATLRAYITRKGGEKVNLP